MTFFLSNEWNYSSFTTMFQVFANWFALRLESVIFFQIFFFLLNYSKKKGANVVDDFPISFVFFFFFKNFARKFFPLDTLFPPPPHPNIWFFFVCSSVSRFIASGARFCLCPSVKNPKLVAPQNKNRRIHISSERGVVLFVNKQTFVIIKLPWHLAAKIQLKI